MAQIKASNMSFAYDGACKVFEGVDFVLDTDWRLGLVGRNGSGKSTLLKLLAGELQPEGTLLCPSSLRCVPLSAPDTGADCESLFFELQPRLERWRVIKELHGLELDEGIMARPVGELSKGEQTKFLLACLFCGDDDFVLLDEPTNHLDMLGRRRVAEYLRGKKGFICVSHDRRFLDLACDHMMAINRTTIDVTAGNYSTWLENKELKDRFELAQNRKLKGEISRLSLAARQAKGWSQKLEKEKNGMTVSGVKANKGKVGFFAARMMRRSKNLEARREKAIVEKRALLHDLEEIESLKIVPLTHRKKTLFEVRNLSFMYDNRTILSNCSFECCRGDKVAVLGPNGCGKTTLLKVLLGQLSPTAGTVSVPSDLKVGYVCQDTSSLRGPLRQRIVDEGCDESLGKAVLRKLGFERDTFDLPLEAMSEGQKKKVLVALSLSKPVHCLVWDEPLNYVDLLSRGQLEEILKASDITAVFVEHDARFVQTVANKTVVLGLGFEQQNLLPGGETGARP